MILKLGEIPDLIKSMNNLIDKELPIKIAYKLKKMYQKLESEARIYEENRIKLLDKYGKKDDKGEFIVENNKIIIPDDRKEDFLKEFEELQEIEVEFDFEPIKETEIKDLKISASDLMNLDKVIEFIEVSDDKEE